LKEAKTQPDLNNTEQNNPHFQKKNLKFFFKKIRVDTRPWIDLI